MIDFDPVREFFFIFTIAIVRLTAACAVVPFMSTQVIPGRLRNSLLFSWGIIIFPMVQPTLSIDTSNMVVLLSIVIKEVVIGILLGFLSSKIFWLAMSVGFFIDNQRGASMASVMDPTSGEQTSPIGQFLQQSILTLFYTAGGFLVFLGGMFESYAIWPFSRSFANCLVSILYSIL